MSCETLTVGNVFRQEVLSPVTPWDSRVWSWWGVFPRSAPPCCLGSVSLPCAYDALSPCLLLRRCCDTIYGEDANSGAVVTCLLSLGSLGADSGPCLLCPEGELSFPSYPAVGAETQQEARIPPSPLGASRCRDDRKSILDPQPCTGGGVVERRASFGVHPSRCPAVMRVYL